MAIEVDVRSVLIQDEAHGNGRGVARHREGRHAPLRGRGRHLREGAPRGVSLDVASGKLTAMMGPSGSGKSTLMHILAGLDHPNEGEVTIAGTDITELDDTELTKLRREHVGFIFQFFNLLPMLTARENVVLPIKLAGEKPDPEWVDELTTQGRPLGATVASSGRALGWSAAAGRDRACARESTDGDVRRRADRQPRLDDER